MTSTSTTPTYLALQEGDSVAVAISPLAAGEPLTLGGVTITPSVEIPAGHKFAIRPVKSGEPVTKYGQMIGYATTDITPGDHVHLHNLAFTDTDSHHVDIAGVPLLEARKPSTFSGIRRSDGRAATRNYVGIITSVNCSATVAKMMAEHVRTSGILNQYPSIDGIVAITHGSGCGMASDGTGLNLLRRTLSGYAAHPNFGALLVLGLGCEVNQIAELDMPEHTPVIPMTIQGSGGTVATIRKGVAAITEILPSLEVQRVPIASSELILGLQCGGSDGYSGITANPALGVASDRLVAEGGTSVLAETPEIYGAEHLLASRAVSQQVADDLMERIEWWRDYTQQNHGSLDNNPSPGNKEGGLTTILEKSLGAVAKAGAAPLSAVRQYAEAIDTPGLVFMDTPGYDPVSVTGLVAGGANIVCFTTGRGSVYGCKPVPSLKLATNSDVYQRLEGDMDINCGVVADGTATLAESGEEIFQRILATASGEKTASETYGFGDEEFTPWQLGAVM